MKVGIVGLGAMGNGMALNLHQHGHLHRIWNRTTAKAEQLAAETGVTMAPSPAELAAASDLVITCVSRDEDVLDVIAQIAASASADTVVVDTSTVSVETARRCATMLADAGMAFLDCPVTGGVEGANNGTLVLMVGGDAAVLERVRKPLQAIASRIVHLGPTGSGQACKAVNQIMCAGINEAVTESLAFGEALGLDMDKVIDVVSGGAAGNWFLDKRGKTMLAGQYDIGFKLSLHHKDLEICKAMAAQLADVSIPVAETCMHNYQTLMERGYGDDEISALYRLKRPHHD